VCCNLLSEIYFFMSSKWDKSRQNELLDANRTGTVNIARVAELHQFDPAPGKNFDAARAAPAPAPNLLHSIPI
jgi:hypothetical protein